MSIYECPVCKDNDLHCINCDKKFIVELEPGVYLAAHSGDPGRTIERSNAKRYRMRLQAENALLDARQYRPFRAAKIVRA